MTKLLWHSESLHIQFPKHDTVNLYVIKIIKSTFNQTCHSSLSIELQTEFDQQQLFISVIHRLTEFLMNKSFSNKTLAHCFFFSHSTISYQMNARDLRLLRYQLSHAVNVLFFHFSVIFGVSQSPTAWLTLLM